MRAIHLPRTREERRYRRHLRVRKKVTGTPERPRLVGFRSLQRVYPQLVDDDRGAPVSGVSDDSEGLVLDGKGKVAKAKATGKPLAARAKAAGIGKVVFDRAGYRYHGRVKAVADGAREGGLEF